MNPNQEHGAGAHGAGEPGAHHGVRSEEDRIRTGAIVAVGVGSLVVFFVASLAATAYLARTEGSNPPIPIGAELGESKIGVVEQQMFGLRLRADRDREARLERLGSYGWVDRGAGVAHMPIEEAMELVAKGVRPAPGRTAGAPPRSTGGQP